VLNRPPACADYWIVGIDYGISNAFACYSLVCQLAWLIKQVKDYGSKKSSIGTAESRTPKLNSELATDVYNMLEPYAIHVFISTLALLLCA